VKARLSAVAVTALALFAVGIAGQASATRSYVPAFSEIKVDKGPVFRDGCLIYTSRVTSPPCHYGEIGSDKKVFVFGDSHSLQWTPALIEIAEQRGWELTMLMRKNCTAAIVNTEALCNRWRLNSMKRIEAEKPDMVVIASNTASNVFVMRNGMRLSREASQPYFLKGMYDTLLRLRRTGAEVTVIRDLPMSKDFLPSDCVQANPDRPGLCSFPAHRLLSESYDYLAAKRFEKVQVIDPLPKVCARHVCRAVQGNVLKYRDRGHMSATYVRLLTGWLRARLQDPFRH